ncbi:MAG: hypothetical protein QXQ57_01070 [Sulfolobales archaeon]
MGFLIRYIALFKTIVFCISGGEFHLAPGISVSLWAHGWLSSPTPRDLHRFNPPGLGA